MARMQFSPRIDPGDSINRNLVAFWPLTEPGGAVATDIGPRQNDLWRGSTPPTRIIGAEGRATNFAGASSQYLERSSFSWPGGFHAAISAWIKVPGSYNGSPYDFGGGRTLGTNDAFYGHLPYGNNVAYFYYGPAGAGETNTSLAAYLDQWIHIAWASSPTRKAIWINGQVATSSISVPTVAVAPGTGAYLGYSPVSAMYHQGAMRLFRLRAQAWTDAEVMRLYRDPWAGTLPLTSRARRTFIASSGTVYTLTATSIATGAPVVGNPALEQNHVLAGTGFATGAPVVGAPGIEQIHVLGGTGIATGAPVIGNPIVGTEVALDGTGIETGAPVVGNPALNGATGGRLRRWRRQIVWDDPPPELAPVVALAENYAADLAVERAVDAAIAKLDRLSARATMLRRAKVLEEVRVSIVEAVARAAEQDDEEALIALL